MAPRSLPPKPSLAQLKTQATDLLREQRDRRVSAAARIAAHHPAWRTQPPAAVLAGHVTLADAQLVVAREYGFASWALLEHFVETTQRLTRFQPHPLLTDAVAALDAGEAGRLSALLAGDAALIHARTNLEPPYHYFTGATLLHHVAGNPARELPLPENIVELARLLLEAGAAVNAETLGPNGGTTMALVLTSRQASDAGVSGPLIDLLIEYGSTLNVHAADVLDAPLANHAPRAAEKLIERGAQVDICAAAALGRLDLLRACFDERGTLSSPPMRRGKLLSQRDAIGLAMLFAYVNGQSAAAEFLLEKDGNWDMIGVNNGTALHRAAWAGDLEMVQRLVARGAHVNDRNNPYTGTPLAWARHSHQHEVAAWLATNAGIDLHDAVAFDLQAQAIARITEDPTAVHNTIDDAVLSRSTPLHWAAMLDRAAMADLLLAHGADVNAVAGNGLTALDLAEEQRADAVAERLRAHDAKSADDL